jgi:hypothetical protein
MLQAAKLLCHFNCHLIPIGPSLGTLGDTLLFMLLSVDADFTYIRYI